LLTKATERETPPNPTDLIAASQSDFGALLEPYRRELQAHCYRMVGSVHEAEDMVQETFLRAWRRRETFEGRATFRAWLYKIATNICLDTLAQRPRRMVPITRGAASSVDRPIPASLMEPIWLEPIPDELFATDDADPESYFVARENISVAFIAALHLLPPRQRAVLLLRDVLEWQAAEVATLLGLTVPAVKSALHRARTTLATHGAKIGADAISARTLDQATRAQLDQYVLAWENSDVSGLLSLLKEDATFSMPPIPSWYQGRETIGKLVSMTVFTPGSNGHWRLLPTRANGQIAFGLYRQAPDGGPHVGYGIQVLRLVDGAIEDIITFREASLFAYFKLPAVFPG
jgi:RNA polymerase sigma-70 factor (ECF subfamily)